MNLSKSIVTLILALTLSWSATAAEQGRRLLLGGCGFGKIILLEQDNSVVWETEEKREVSDLWLLENGNIVHSTKDDFQEIKPNYTTGKGAAVVWSVKAPAGSECHTAQPIGKDRYLVGYSSKTRSYLAEVDSKGKEYKVIEVKGQKGKHSSFRQVRKTSAGTYLTSQQKKGGKAREYDAAGKLIRTFPRDTSLHFGLKMETPSLAVVANTALSRWTRINPLITP